MKHNLFKSLTLAAALMTSMMGWAAIDWSKIDWVGNGTTNQAYTEKYKISMDNGQQVANIQQAPWDNNNTGIYTWFESAISSCSLQDVGIQGAGILLHLSAFTAKETEVSVVCADKTYTFYVYYADGTGDTPGPGPGPGPGPEVTGPTAAPTAPTYPANQVKAVYSDTYSADCDFGEWGSGTTYTQDTYGKKYVTGALGYFGICFEGTKALNCSKMESLHLDVYSLTATSIRVVPIHGGTEVGVTKSLTAGQWNAIDIALSEFAGVSNWTNVYQIKIDNAASLTLWMNNIYFYTTQAPETDTEAPTDFTASLKAASYFSADVNVQATDNSGSVMFVAYNGETAVDSMSAVSATASVMTVKNLLPNTAYSFVIKARDEAGNVNASPVTVAVTTLTAPQSAPAPTVEADKVMSIFSDAYTAVTWFNVGSWWQSTVTTKGNLAEGDEVMLCTNSNYLGWELQAPIPSFATMEKVHFDVYVDAAASIQFTPIWGSSQESLKTYQLVAGWNSIDTSLSDWSGLDKTNIYQLKWAEMPATCWIDNVYFYKTSATGLQVVNAQNAVARKVMENGRIVICTPQGKMSVMGQRIQ